MTRHVVAVHQHFRRQRPAVVVRGHRRAVRAGVAHGERSPTSSGGSSRSRPKTSLLSQTGPTISYGRGSPGARRHGLDAVKGAVERRPHQLGHAGVEDDERAARRVLLDVDDAREQHAGGADERAAGLDHER